MSEHAVIQYSRTAGILTADHSGKLGVGDHVVLEVDVIDGVTGVGIISHLNDSAVVVEDELVFQAVSLGRIGRMACGSPVVRNREECGSGFQRLLRCCRVKPES